MDLVEESKIEILAIPTLGSDDNNSLSPITSVALARKLRQLRLTALKLSPEAFASSYDIEQQRGIDHTLERLSNPKAATLVALRVATAGGGAEHRKNEIDQLLSTEWVGMVVLIGPRDAGKPPASARADPFSCMTEPAVQCKIPEAQSSSSTTKLHYHLNAVFVHPSARHIGLGKALINAALRKAKEQAKRFRREYVCSILVDSWNITAWRLYESAGFVQVGEETYVQQPRADLGESERRERVAIRMELHGAV